MTIFNQTEQDVVATLKDAAEQSKAWPFEEARKLVARVKKTGQTSVLFATGYGPSGLPHIGTFGEVARTTMVRHAFRVLTEDKIPTRLIAFSDDMDGLRKVPDNVPNKELLAANLGKPLTKVPDPFGTHASFGAHNNARLQAFLDTFGFEYEFASATAYYQAGKFDAMLLRLLANFDKVQAIMLPSLREERAQSYAPFLPIHPKTGIVMQVPLTDMNVAAGTVSWNCPDTGETFVTPVTGGHCKLQWKPDWAMRWCALGVDYEMAGKDLTDSRKLSGEIARALGGVPPEGFIYELFLDGQGQKISKSKGNGLTIEEWLRYAPQESLSLFMFQKPTAAKRLHFDVIPRAVDEYLTFLEAAARQETAGDAKELLGNPVWHVHSGAPPAPEVLTLSDGSTATLSFAMLLNLAAVANTEDVDVLWGFVRQYAPTAAPQSHPRLAALLVYALAYFRDFVRPKRLYHAPDDVERAALETLRDVLLALPEDASAELIQTKLYDIARAIPRYQDFAAKGATPERPGVSNDWFAMLYRVLLGAEKGPRFGSFVALYGIKNSVTLIEKSLSGALIREQDALVAGQIS